MALAPSALGMTLSGAHLHVRVVVPVLVLLSGMWSPHERNRIFPACGRRL